MTRTPPDPAKNRIALSMGKATILTEAMPFMQELKGKTIVIRYGGSAMADETLRHSLAGDVALLALVGIQPVIVHGGGPQLARAIGQAGVEPQLVDGMQVTDLDAIRVVQTTLAGEINPDIVRLLGSYGAKAAGITGIDCNLFVASQLDPKLGFAGEVQQVNPELIHATLADDIIPVIAPLALADDGQVYVINADLAAGSLAIALGAEKLVHLTDVAGLYRVLGDQGSLIQRVTSEYFRELIDGGTVSNEMLPKLESCIRAVEGGVRRAHVLDGRVQHALLLEFFTPEGIGTMVRK